MTVDITSGITGFFSVFSAVYNWLNTFTITIGSISFTFIQLIVSLIVISMIINFVYRLLEGD